MTAWSYKRCRSKSAAIQKRPHYDQYSLLHKLLEADVIFGHSIKICERVKLNRTVNEAMQRMTIEATSKENDYCKQSFKKCSFSNDLGGAEDDILWEEQHDKSDTDLKEEGDAW